jgi:hypothetical protein
MKVAHGIADHARGIEHVLGAVDARRDVAVLGRLMQQIDHGLGDGEVAGREQHQDPLTRLVEGGHFAEGVDLVDPGVGPRIGQEHQPGVHQQADAVSHG